MQNTEQLAQQHSQPSEPHFARLQSNEISSLLTNNDRDNTSDRTRRGASASRHQQVRGLHPLLYLLYRYIYQLAALPFNKHSSNPSLPHPPQAEARRRSRINDRLNLLRQLIPNAARANTCEFLDMANDYVKRLQLRVIDLERQLMIHPSNPKGGGSSRPVGNSDQDTTICQPTTNPDSGGGDMGGRQGGGKSGGGGNNLAMTQQQYVQLMQLQQIQQQQQQQLQQIPQMQMQQQQQQQQQRLPYGNFYTSDQQQQCGMALAMKDLPTASEELEMAADLQPTHVVSSKRATGDTAEDEEDGKKRMRS